MKEMIERLIADGWKWVACDKDEMIFIYKNKPDLNIRENFCGYSKHHIPSCLFPDITFENSPVELKTLLVDDREDDEEQDFIKSLINSGCQYLIKEWTDDVKAISNNETDFYMAHKIKHLCPNKYEKVYLKDLVKKRKVKKSVWVAVDKEEDKIFLLGEKPFRNGDKFVINSNRYTEIEDLDFFYPKKITWEDEPIELTYEVEE